jgi:hypothetical protein
LSSQKIMEHNRCTIFTSSNLNTKELISGFNLLNLSVKSTTYIYLEVDR